MKPPGVRVFAQHHPSVSARSDVPEPLVLGLPGSGDIHEPSLGWWDAGWGEEALHAQLTAASPSVQFQSNAALFEAVELQDLDRVQELLKQYSPEELDLNTPNSEGLLPLDIAIMTNNAPIARALLQAGAKESPHCELAGEQAEIARTVAMLLSAWGFHLPPGSPHMWWAGAGCATPTSPARAADPVVYCMCHGAAGNGAASTFQSRKLGELWCWGGNRCSDPAPCLPGHTLGSSAVPASKALQQGRGLRAGIWCQHSLAPKTVPLTTFF